MPTLNIYLGDRWHAPAVCKCMEHFLLLPLSHLVLPTRRWTMWFVRMQMWRWKPTDGMSSSLEFFRKSSGLFKLFKLKMGFASLVLQCLYVKAVMFPALEVFSETLNHSRFVFDPQLVLTSLPLCYFMVSIPVEENLLIGPSRCIIFIFWMFLLPHEGSGRQKAAPWQQLLRKLVMRGEKDILIFSPDSALFAVEVWVWRSVASIHLNLISLCTNSLHWFSKQWFKR